MSESFSDPLALAPEITFKEDPIPNIHQLINSSIGGKVLVSEYGGGTANMEFELLTGFSTALFSGIPYQDFASKDENFPSFLKVLKEAGYQTAAIHPYDGNMYKRSTVYPNIGIDELIDQRTMKNQEKLENSSFISDSSAYAETLELLKNAKEKLFVNLITMQNHQPYGSNVYKSPVSFETQLDLTAEEKNKIGIYERGLSYTDEATGEFIEKLKELPKDTLVVFYGDHFPGQNVFGKLYEGAAKDYLTPFFIYDTSQDLKVKNEVTSLNYLQLEVAKALGLKFTPFMNLLSELKKEWPAISRPLAIDAEGKEISASEISGSTYEDYRIIAYDLIAGKQYALKTNFFN